MPMFDPSSPMPDLEAQVQNAVRQRLLADRLRKQADQPGPRGQLVQGRYVAPHWSQHLGGLVDALSASYAEKRANAAEQANEQAQGQAAQQWRSQMPTDIPGSVAIPGDIDNRSDMPTGVDATAGQPLTRQRILQHTLAGLANPRTAKEAGIVNQSLTSDLQRKEDMGFRDEEARKAEVFRASESEKARVQAADLKREGLANQLAMIEMRMDDKTLDRAQQERLQLRHQDLMDQWKKATDATQRHIADLVHDVGMKRVAGTGVEKPTTEGEKTSAGFLNRMRESEKVLQDPGVSKGKPSVLTKTLGAIPIVGGVARPFAESTAQQRYRQAQEDWVRAKLRKESGAQIPTAEMDREIDTYFPQPGETSKDLIAQKAASRKAAERQLEIGAGREAKNANMGGGGNKTGITIEEVD